MLRCIPMTYLEFEHIYARWRETAKPHEDWAIYQITNYEPGEYLELSGIVFDILYKRLISIKGLSRAV